MAAAGDSAGELDFQVRMLDALCPPVLGFGIGGSQGAAQADQHSDLDFFLLVPDEQLFDFIESFPALVRHRTPPVLVRDRGFWPEFGYQFTYVYETRQVLDYFINSPRTLRKTPMARKTRIIKDSDGRFTAYQREIAEYCASPHAARDYHAAARAEILVELLTIAKHLRRHDLIPAAHRLDRLRGVYLGLARYHRNAEPYAPHDADKRVTRALGPAIYDAVAGTFPRLSEADIADSLGRLADLLDAELAADSAPGGAAFRADCREIVANARRGLRE
jgi:hypothetical protein